ncbi:hypothetical protein niasHT_017750 [Heterodera trifolii]|uniref:Uncharacterized protein n=1 Tax=Heterodera trifolii TaxID=157864 RepID=A0ABD2LJP7_9BILA
MNNNEPNGGDTNADNDEPNHVGAGRTTTTPEQRQQTAEGAMPAQGSTEATAGGVNADAILNEPVIDGQQQLDEVGLAAPLLDVPPVVVENPAAPLPVNGGVQDEEIVQEQQLVDLGNIDELLAGIRHTFVNFRNRANWEIDRIGGRLQGIRHTLVNFRDPANAEIDRIDGRLQGRFAVLGRLIRQCDDFINYLGVLANLLDELRRQGANSVPGSSDVLLIPLNCVTVLRLFLIVLRATMSLSMEPVPFAMLSVTCVCLSSSFFGYFHMITVYLFIIFLLFSLIHLLPLYYHFFG